MKKFLYIIMCGVLLLSGCEEDNEPLAYPPTLASGSVTEMTRGQAVLSGAAIPHPSSIVKCDIGFMVATSDNMADAESFVGTEESDGSNQYRATATGLKPGTQYYFCIYAKSGNTLVKGPVQSFTTEESIAPIVSVPTVISKDETTLTLSSQVTDDGDDTPTIRLLIKYILKATPTRPRAITLYWVPSRQHVEKRILSLVLLSICNPIQPMPYGHMPPIKPEPDTARSLH